MVMVVWPSPAPTNERSPCGVRYGCDRPRPRSRAQHHEPAGAGRQPLRRADVPEGVEIVAADASDAETAAKAATGAGSSTSALAPRTTNGPGFPPIQDAAVHAARAAHARYVSFENTYMYGDTHGVLITEETPLTSADP